MRLIDAETLKVSITRYCAKHAEHQKRRRLKDHTSELCRDICFAIDAMPTEVGEWVHVPGHCTPGGDPKEEAPHWEAETYYYGDGQHSYTLYRCPVCHARYMSPTDYCPHCGKPLNRSERND